MVPDKDMLTADHVLTILKHALNKRQPLSLVRVGDGENVVFAQNTVMPVEKVLQIGWAKEANKGLKGVTLPNLKLRDQMAAAIRKADIVGIPYWKNDPIIARQSLKRPLTEDVFNHLNLKPKRVCHTFVNRVFGKNMDFWNLLRGKRIMLVSSWAESVKPILEQKPYGVTIHFIYNFKDYRQIPQTLKFIRERKDKFDIALVSCGVNAVVLCPEIAEITGKVAIDFGKSLMFIVNEQTKPN